MKFPAGTHCGLGIAPDGLAGIGQDGYGFFVFVTQPDQTPNCGLLEMLTRPGAVNAVLTHEPGFTWPRAYGVRLMQTALANGGSAALAFTTLAAAMACHKRMLRELDAVGA